MSTSLQTPIHRSKAIALIAYASQIERLYKQHDSVLSNMKITFQVSKECMGFSVELRVNENLRITSSGSKPITVLNSFCVGRGQQGYVSTVAC